ncbi:NACHT domain-containing protein [Amycolatopsis sp. cg5]|uniref:NACHT domain-containing protein n=1 Tax=Amycolatopsis sp. cg5 TaxID=3238802 RepID=UPI003525D52F
MKVLWSFAGIACTVALGLIVAVLVHEGGRGDELSSIGSFATALATAAVALGAWLWRRQHRETADEAADELAHTLRNRELDALGQLLAARGDLSPAKVDFLVREHLSERSDGGLSQGTIADSARYYRALERGRLVVLGDSGAGKSVLLVQLALELLNQQTEEQEPRSRLPVRMNLASFDPFHDGRTVDQLGDSVLTTRYDSWLTSQLTQLGIRRQLAAQLVADDRVLPLLDGLDEARDVQRSVAVLRVLNVRARFRPFVLTSRTTWFEQVVTDERLCDASVVELQPLSPQAVREYLVDRLGTHAADYRWRTALNAIESAENDELKWPNPFADALRSPWRLYLCCTIFAASGDPYRELAGLAPEEMTNQLLARLIPALSEQHGRVHGVEWPATDVTSWLRVMARRNERLLPDTAEITLPALWPAAGRILPRFAGAVLQSLTGWALAVAVAAFIVEYPAVLSIDTPWPAKLVIVTFLLSMVGATSLMNTGMPVTVSRLSTHLWRTRNGRRTLI